MSSKIATTSKTDLERPGNETTDQAGSWFVYIVRCRDGSLYTGITTAIERRVQEHNNAKTGAKYTKARRPVELIYYECWSTRSEASKREADIKRLSAADKRSLCDSR